MPAIDAREAIEYATDGEWLKLYGVVLGGWLLAVLARFVISVFTLPGTGLLGGVLLLGAAGVVLVGLVAGAYKLLSETGPAG